jgi:hypothetical protein
MGYDKRYRRASRYPPAKTGVEDMQQIVGYPLQYGQILPLGIAAIDNVFYMRTISTNASQRML